jgi:hypothetical protein
VSSMIDRCGPLCASHPSVFVQPLQLMLAVSVHRWPRSARPKH